MRRLIFLYLVIISVFSCNKNYKTDDRKAISAGPVPVFSSLDGSPVFSYVPAFTPVYFTDERSTIDTVEFVKIEWNDSSAWARKSQFMLHGKVAVVISGSPLSPQIRVYEKEDTMKWTTSFGGAFTLAVAETPGKQTTRIMIWQGLPFFADVANSSVLTDTTEVALYKEYTAREGMAGQNSIAEDPRYKNTTLARYILRPVELDVPEVDDEPHEEYDGMALFEFEQDKPWADSEGNPVEDSPAQVKAYIIFDDDTEIERGIFFISNGHLDGYQADKARLVKGVRFEINPDSPGDIKIKKRVWNGIGDYQLDTEETITGAQADKPYSVTLLDSDELHVTCSSSSVTFTIDGLSTTTNVRGVCGN